MNPTKTLTHTDLLNKIIKDHGFKRYAEIGTFDQNHNFNKIECRYRICVDPDPKAKANYFGTSDEFFEQNFIIWDCVFIDGLHHADQVKKDFDNAMKWLSEDGCVILHDTNPHSERITHVPRDSGEWTGNVYQFAVQLNTYDGIDFYTFPGDYGCTVVWKDITKKGFEIGEVSWERFDRERAELLRFKTDI